MNDPRHGSSKPPSSAGEPASFVVPSRPPSSIRPASNRLSDAPSAHRSSIPPDDDQGSSLDALCSIVSPDDLSVVFQPIVSMSTGETFAQEALVRCANPAFRSPPVLFEHSVTAGCTGRLGRMIREIGIPHASGAPLFVNIHPRELSEGWLVRPDDPVFAHDDDIYIEVTESVPMTYFDLCMAVLREIGSRGRVYIVIDDLGAGYSNLLRIADLEPRFVKLDRELVAGVDRNKRKRELLNAVVHLCHQLGADVVAEGVETLGELEAVRDSGAGYAQGFLLARPAFPTPTVNWPLDRSPPPGTARAGRPVR